MTREIQVWADGSATTSANAGGWASVIVIDGKMHKELSGHMPSATNNDAELAAAVNGLKYVHDQLMESELSIKEFGQVTLISDSEIVLNWANGKYRFKQLEKLGEYNRLMTLMKTTEAKTLWCKGHSGVKWNERCDRLANLARKQIPEVPGDQVQNKTQSVIGSKKTSVFSVWHKGKLFVIDLEFGIVESYNREAHGKRGSIIEIREGKE